MPNANAAPAYRDASLAPEQRVADLLGRMTIEEKAAQMSCVWNNKLTTLLDESGAFDPAKAKEHYGHGHGLGQVGRPGDACGGAYPRAFADLTNTIQRFFLENSRLGIPVLFHDESLHGLVARGATSFPQPIALGATFNPELVQKIYTAVSKEARAVGVHQALAPVLDVARDPRWGRVEETFGEDTFLVSELGLAAVRGYQGAEPYADSEHVVCTLKHFAAHGQPEAGNNCAPVSVSERHLREVFLYPFQRAVQEGKAQSVMASYNEIDGLPSHASQWLLRKTLREDWGFEGTVVSDYYAIRELWERPELYGHHVAANREEAATLAVRAGVNIELPEPDIYVVIPEMVKRGALTEREIDELVKPLLLQKFNLGLFEHPYIDPAKAEQVLGCTAHADLALQAARESITLLKNEGGLLPLKTDRVKRIAVIGPNADRVMLGGYSGKPEKCVTLLEGLRKALGDAAELVHTVGCHITKGGGWFEDVVTPSDPAEDEQLIAEAKKLAESADLVVLAVGGNEQTSREAWMGNHLGDRTNLQMVGRQDDLVDAIHTTGKPIASVLFNGRPLAVSNLAEKSAALLECFYLGQQSGAAIAEVLLGRCNPSGKLPITIPRSVGHIPAYYSYRPSARRGYLFDDVSPLFPFGFGLSYATFTIGPPTLTRSEIAATESTTVQVELTNTSGVAGAETVQLYIRDRVSSVTRPVKELKAFKKVWLEPGASQVVQLAIGPEQLAFWNLDMQFVVEPGEFEIQIGANSVDVQACTLAVRV